MQTAIHRLEFDGNNSLPPPTQLPFCMTMSMTSAQEHLQWPSFPVMVKNSWLVKPSSCNGSSSSKQLLQRRDTPDKIVDREFLYVDDAPQCKKKKKMPLTGFDICRLRVGFMERVLVFEPTTTSGEEEEDHGLRSLEPLSVRLRESLAKALEYCHPLAGRLMQEEDGTFAIDCDDSGVLFVEASSPIPVGELRDDRLLHSYENFCPLDRSNIPEIGGLLDVLPLFAAQLTTFNNGGYALGIMFCHAIADGPCAWQFVSSWAQVCRGEKQATHCCFDFSSRTNVIDLKLHSGNLEMTTLMELPQSWKKHKLSPHNILVCHVPPTRPTASKHLFLRIHPDLVRKLKSQLAQEEDDQDTHMDGKVATRFSSYVVISALLWRASIRARNIPDLQDSRFIFAIDCRMRCNNVPKNYFGNIILDAVSVANVSKLLCHQRISFAAKAIHNSLQELTSGNNIQSFSNMMQQEKQCAFNAKFRQETDVFVAGMIYNPLLACDFGLGLPCCIKSDVLRLCNNFLLWCPKAKPSDAWVLIFKAASDVADRMLQDPELMAFMTLDYAQ